MRLSRAAFSVIVKFSELTESFSSLVDEVDMLHAELEGDEERDIKIKEMIKKAHDFEQLFKRWESASKMRQWISEHKKELIEQIKEDVDKSNRDLPEAEREALTDSRYTHELA